jgi:hypothetical protein
MSMIEQVAADLSHGARWLRRHLRFTGLSTLIIAIGVGGSTAIFSVADAVVLRPLPYAEADRLFVIQEHDRPRDTRGPASYPAFADWRNGSRSFEAFAAATAEHLEVTLTGRGEPVSSPPPLSAASSLSCWVSSRSSVEPFSRMTTSRAPPPPF